MPAHFEGERFKKREIELPAKDAQSFVLIYYRTPEESPEIIGFTRIDVTELPFASTRPHGIETLFSQSGLAAVYTRIEKGKPKHFIQPITASYEEGQLPITLGADGNLTFTLFDRESLTVDCNNGTGSCSLDQVVEI